MRAELDPCLGLLRDVAITDGLADVRVDSDHLVARVALRTVDGDRSEYQVAIRTPDGGLEVAELVPYRRLPTACPQRHINHGGTFCLGWAPDRVKGGPKTREEAVAWWGRLAHYLSLQDLATCTRRWPVEYAWPHGEAARAQYELEQTLTSLPPSVRRHAAQLGENAVGRLPDRRMRCPCGKKRTLRRCHEGVLLKVAKLRREVAAHEEAFWAAWRERPCCGTMDGCRAGIARPETSPAVDLDGSSCAGEADCGAPRSSRRSTTNSGGEGAEAEI